MSVNIQTKRIISSKGRPVRIDARSIFAVYSAQARAPIGTTESSMLVLVLVMEDPGATQNFVTHS